MNRVEASGVRPQPTSGTNLPRGRAVWGLIGWLAFAFAASLGGALVSVDDWYAELAKPSWNPPSWLFGPVWSLLYVMMGVAAWRVWLHGGWPAQTRPLTAFVVQWGLNAIWTPLFFGWHQIGWALVDIVGLWLAIGLTIVLFFRVSRLAGLLLLPYWAWVTFATALNFTLWRMN